jgi:hypothetical protein
LSIRTIFAARVIATCDDLPTSNVDVWGRRTIRPREGKFGFASQTILSCILSELR